MATRNGNARQPIVFVSKNDLALQRLVDAFRLMAWKEYKRAYDGDLSPFDLYQVFREAWLKHDIHSKSYEELTKLVEDLGWTVGEMLKSRNEHYERRDAWREANGVGSDGKPVSQEQRRPEPQPEPQQPEESPF